MHSLPPPPIVRPDPYPGTDRKVTKVGNGYRCYVMVKNGRVQNVLYCEILGLPSAQKAPAL